ncbi:MAG: ATP-binding protein [Desulfobulbaceae bacterium]|nr:ATP-binding protein [Desulfobulbaceae bacterium]
MNPFKYGQVVQDKDFCQRPDLIKRLSEVITKGQNVYVQGERRIGKTSLICECVRQLKKHRLIYIDLLEVKETDDFIKRIISAIVSMEQKGGMVERILKKLAHIRPTISFDPLTGMPTIGFDETIAFSQDSIHGVLDLIYSYHTKQRSIVVVFDEFQDILNLKDAKEILAVLRSKVQFHSDVSYIFSGSVRNKMVEIFTYPDSPFYKSATSLDVGPLDQDNFRAFLKKKFNKGKREIAPEVWEKIFEISAHVPGDIQQFCDALWDITSEKEHITLEHLPKALESIFAHEFKGYETTLKIISGQQLKVLTGLARMGGKAPTSAKFAKGLGGIATSSIQKAIERLMDLKIVFYFEDEYRFTNPFFRAWLLYKNL